MQTSSLQAWAESQLGISTSSNSSFWRLSNGTSLYLLKNTKATTTVFNPTKVKIHNHHNQLGFSNSNQHGPIRSKPKATVDILMLMKLPSSKTSKRVWLPKLKWRLCHRTPTKTLTMLLRNSLHNNSLCNPCLSNIWQVRHRPSPISSSFWTMHQTRCSLTRECKSVRDLCQLRCNSNSNMSYCSSRRSKDVCLRSSSSNRF